jgi:hypothetical protein
MCCLRYEYDAYKDFKTRAPKRGAIVETPVGLGKITDLNTPKETVTVRLEDGSNFTIPLAGMCCSKGTGCPCSVSQEALDAVRPVSALLVGAESSAAPARPARRKPERREQEQPSRQPKPGGKRQGGKAPEAQKAPTGAAPKAASGSGEGAAASGEQAPKASSGGRRRRRRRSSGGGAPSSGAKPEGA